MPSAQGIAGYPTTRRSLLKPGTICQPEQVISLLTNLVEETFHRIQPTARSRVVPVATGADGILKFLQQRYLLRCQVHGRFHSDPGEEVTGAMVSDGSHTLAAQSENFARLRS